MRDGARSKRGCAPWIAAALLLAAVPLACAGCWGSIDIEERAFVIMLGIDSQEGRMRVSAQVAVNERMAREGAGKEDEAFVVVSHDAESASEGIHLLQDTVAMPVYLGHLKVVVLGEEFVRERGISEAVDALLRDPEVRGQVWIAQAEGRAEDFLRIRLKAERLPGTYVERLLNVGIEYGHAPDARLVTVASHLDTPGYHPLLPVIEKKEETVEIDGATVCRGDVAVGRLEHPEVHDFTLITGAPSVGVYSVPSPRGEGKLYAVVRNPRCSVRVRQEGSQVTIYLRVSAEAEAVQDTGHQGAPPAGWAEAARRVPGIERLLAEEIERRVSGLIGKVQRDFRADIFGFVRYAGRLKLEQGRWDEVFPAARVVVEVQVRLRRFGLGEA